MDSTIKNYIERSDNEIIIAVSLLRLSEDKDAKKYFNIDDWQTFYSAVISHSYYSIFYAAKAILLTKGIKTFAPDVHNNTIASFKENLVDTGILDVKLLEIYSKLVVRADELLGIFAREKSKRGDFTYKTLPQAHKIPSDDSLKNAQIFNMNIKKVINKK